MWEIFYRNPFTLEWEHSMFTKSKDTVERLTKLGKKAVAVSIA